MNYVIKWSHEAEVTIAQNSDYLLHNWGEKTASKFLKTVKAAVQKIGKNPRSYPMYKSMPDTRRFTINKRVFLYYRIEDDNSIVLITFWNTYQNPENLKL
jgi:plasmid stabilization system protein ParE